MNNKDTAIAFPVGYLPLVPKGHAAKIKTKRPCTLSYINFEMACGAICFHCFPKCS